MEMGHASSLVVSLRAEQEMPRKRPSKALTASEAAVELCLTREQTIRRIQNGSLTGWRDDRGFWFVDAHDLTEATRLRRARRVLPG